MGCDSTLSLLRNERARISELKHVGVLVPWANTVVETELPQLAADRLVFHYARLVPASRSTALDDPFLDGLREAVPAALVSLSRIRLAGTVLACTSAGFTAKDTTAEVTSAFTAILHALEQLKVRRIALAAPYPHTTAVAEASAFGSVGVTVTGLASLGQADDYDQIAPDTSRDLIGRLSGEELADASALVLSCTNWPTLHLIADLEAALGMPVISSNLALAIAACTIGDQP
ncbi:maleate cis-trans isomerase family protein [Catenulispora pinisilvae]|uniref:maleate cis-trans isomerase family protein n=1 Tax=Catenulispora pinisilvae TaxID=2705253 RepID=UPI0018916ACB|nr:aspartate/glutamate racemase family protein [Catenulispora pinisilvae]